MFMYIYSTYLLCMELYTFTYFTFQIYNEALIIHSNARASDALCYILQNIQDLQISDTGTEIEIRAKALFESQYHFQWSWPSFKKKRLSVLLEKMLTICKKCAGIKKKWKLSAYWLLLLVEQNKILYIYKLLMI